MLMNTPLAFSLSNRTHEILADAPEAKDFRDDNGVKLTVDKLVRVAAVQGLEVTDDSTSDIEQGFIDLLLEGDGLSHVDVAEVDVNEIMRRTSACAASNGIRCHFVVRVHISYDPKE